jgi:hypothetical protein
MAVLSPTDETIAHLKSATAGFDLIFSNELESAENLFKTDDSALHLLGSGACAFLQAALSMEVCSHICNTAVEIMKHALIPPCHQAGLIAEASALLEQAEAGAKKQLKNAKNLRQTGRFPTATEWEIIYSDCVILLGMTYALRYFLSVILSFPSTWILAAQPLISLPLRLLECLYNAHDSESYYGYLQCL